MFGKNFSRKKILLWFVGLLLIVTHTHFLVAADRPGAVFLMIPPGARALGMGAAFTGSCNDPSSFYYNPGALAFYDRFGLVILNQGLPPGIGRLLEQGILVGSGTIFYGETIHLEPSWLSQLYLDMRYVYSSYAMPIDGIGNFGLHVTYLNTGETEVRNFEGILLGTYESYDAAVSLSFGKTFFNRLGIGITGKYIYSYQVPAWVWEEMPELGIEYGGIGTAWAADIGILYRMWGVGIGASVLNLGTDIRYTESGSPFRLPLRIRGGISIEPLVTLDSLLQNRTIEIFGKPIHDIVNVTLNYDRAYDPQQPDDTWECKGCEFTFLNFFSYRVGKWNIMGNSSGFGFNLRNVELDIAKYFGYDTYHVQLTLHAIEPPENIKNNKTLNTWLTVASAAIAPGGGQFYKGEGIKASLFFVPGLYLGNSFLTTDSGTTRDLSLVGLVILYVGAGLEALLNN
jgi:hypothetical protein